MNRPSATDWARLDAMTEEEIDTSDIPELTEEELAHMVVQEPRLFTIRIDADLLAWFAAQEGDVAQAIDRVLRSYIAAHSTANS